LNLFGKNLDNEVVVIAEIGNNHEGSVERAIELMKLAEDAGADAVKFQAGTVEGGPPRTGKDFTLTMPQLAEVAREAAKPFFCSALSMDAVDFCSQFPVIKIASRGCKDRLLISLREKTDDVGIGVSVGRQFGTRELACPPINRVCTFFMVCFS